MPGIQVYLSETSDDNLKVNKTLNHLGGYQAELLEECSIDNPKFIVTNTDASALLSVNYAYIPDFHRYYYAKCTILDGVRFQFDLSVDRLMSFVNPNKANITAYIERNETDYNNDIKDEQGVFKDERDTVTRLVTNNISLPLSIDNWKLLGLFNAGLCTDTTN